MPKAKSEKTLQETLTEEIKDLLEKPDLDFHLNGREIAFRNGDLIVKVRPLGCVVEAFLRDRNVSFKTDQTIQINQSMTLLDFVQHGIEWATLKGKKLRSTTIVIRKKSLTILHDDELDTFTDEERAIIYNVVMAAKDLSETEKNA